MLLAAMPTMLPTQKADVEGEIFSMAFEFF
jgi:hypothetical protein